MLKLKEFMKVVVAVSEDKYIQQNSFSELILVN
jgi:hypothetical protein